LEVSRYVNTQTTSEYPSWNFICYR